MINRRCCALLLGATIVLTVVLVVGANSIVESKDVQEAKLLKIFDFQIFKKMFHKHYGSLVEEAVRFKYFILRACRAFASAVKYKLGQTTFYLRLNHMSDYYPEELKMMGNKVVGGMRGSKLMRQPEEDEALKNIINASKNADSVGEKSDKKSEEFVDEDEEVRQSKPDEIFVDYRGDCMGEIRDQGICGSCYAFASIALYEWYYCKHTGEYVEFSEQFMLDCGPDNVKGVGGCEGGSFFGAVLFTHSFGLQFRKSYPYKGYQETCPYKKTDLKEIAHVRQNVIFLTIPIEKLAHYLKLLGPALISTQLSSSFYEYGGGIHTRKDCSSSCSQWHAMILVGHGRENGLEYWILRNSHSDQWGEKGYYRVTTDSELSCLGSGANFFVNTDSIKDLSVKPYIVDDMEWPFWVVAEPI